MKNPRTLFKKIEFAMIVGMALLFFATFAIDVRAQSDLQKGIDIYNKKNYYGAKKFFQDYLITHPEMAEAYYYLGRIELVEKNPEQATEYFDKAVEIDSRESEYLTWQGIAYIQLLSKVDFMRQGIYAPKALRALETAVELDPENIDARMWLAGYYSEAPVFAGGSEEKAKEQYEAVLQINPDFVPGYVNYGLMLLKLEEYEPAFQNLERALEIDSDNYSVCLNMGKLSAESGRYLTQGEMALKKFIALGGDAYRDSLDEAWWYLGTIYLHHENTKQARSAFEKALALDPANEEYQKSLKKLM